MHAMVRRFSLGFDAALSAAFIPGHGCACSSLQTAGFSDRTPITMAMR